MLQLWNAKSVVVVEINNREVLRLEHKKRSRSVKTQKLKRSRFVKTKKLERNRLVKTQKLNVLRE